MPKYLCDYCQVWLTHDSQSVRKAHNAGRAHLQNVQDYYTRVAQEEAQKRLEEDSSRGGLKESSSLQLPLAYAFPPKLYQFQFTYPPPPNIVPANVYMAPRSSVPTTAPMPYIPAATTFNTPYPNASTTTATMPVANASPDVNVAQPFTHNGPRPRTLNNPQMTGKQHPYHYKKQSYARSSRT
ncbi:U1 snRNP-associated protein Usp103 [Schizosaccharomyces cryophilus OY26]|uniref:U1 snRNP-associated protein Usp103 n=1 Tax=Schizosaccharomyces cryophilus (strain OY26 / ATCC MYA-4695 / CBS 11777 / NBRC 106824 / NRRL Y48691) TaxID=653667 RepID=S9W8W2_SCHCR|nr:U1 snRNP-associated protein Usp103 [Schizosaccharomyces cryophilus OY26]EPY54315.1 U1 snRNP-associated protein Usp103 [Schizosaccharomyces cryophilus OY26]